MTRFALLLIWGVTTSVTPSPFGEGWKSVFGVRISIGASSQITTFACYLHNGRVLTNKRIVDKNTFIKFASGYWPSIYNPDRKNLFKENGIECDVFKDSVTHKDMPSCIPLDSLWKIRFATYPFRGRPEAGWSNKLYKPSPGQLVYINHRYGVDHIDGDFFLDTSFWLLLNDVMDPNWINSYKAIE